VAAVFAVVNHWKAIVAVLGGKIRPVAWQVVGVSIDTEHAKVYAESQCANAA
jgi:hypothetical protein